MIQVDKFCCCCSLKSGAVVVGVFMIIVSLIIAAESIYGLTGGDIVADLDLDIHNFVAVKPDETSAIFNLIACILNILAASSLLFGTFKSKPEFVFHILIIIPMSLTIQWIAFIVLISIGNSDIIIIVIPRLLIETLLLVYFWICIFSFRKKLKEEAGKAKEETIEITV